LVQATIKQDAGAFRLNKMLRPCCRPGCSAEGDFHVMISSGFAVPSQEMSELNYSEFFDENKEHFIILIALKI